MPFIVIVLVMLISIGCNSTNKRQKAAEEVKEHYSKAQPEIQEYVLWTAKGFGRSGLWLNEDAFAALSEQEREKKS